MKTTMTGKHMITLYFFLLLSCTPLCKAQIFDTNNLGGFSISIELFTYITNLLPAGKTILELGSGSGTGELARYYCMYSIEHDARWLNKYQTTYIYAPIVSYGTHRWYDVSMVKNLLPIHYDLILIDGPTGTIGREGFYEQLHLFNTNAPLIFDDVNRPAELALLKKVSKTVNRAYTIHHCSDGKSFGVIVPY